MRAGERFPSGRAALKCLCVITRSLTDRTPPGTLGRRPYKICTDINTEDSNKYPSPQCDERNGIVTSSCRRSVGKTTRYGIPTVARSFNRPGMFGSLRQQCPDHCARRCICGSSPADLDVHPRVAMAVLRHAQFFGHNEDLHQGHACRAEEAGGQPRMTYSVLGCCTDREKGHLVPDGGPLTLG